MDKLNTQFGGAPRASLGLKQFFTQYKILALLVVIALMWLYFGWKTDGGFTSARNLSNLMRQMSVTGILACGMVLVIISGEIDLSVGSLLGLLGVVGVFVDATVDAVLRPCGGSRRGDQ